MVDVWAIDSSSGTPTYSGYDLRSTTVAPFMAGNGVGVGVRTGVRLSGSGTDLLVQAQASPNMSVLVNPGVIVVQGTYTATQGPYTWALDTQTTLTISASHATLDRTDLVAVRIRDSNIDSSGARDGAVIVITGTPGSGTPSLPTDATYVTIAQVSVPHASTSVTSGQITDKRPFTCAVGGEIPCVSTARPTAASCAPYQKIIEIDTGLVYRSNGSKWIRDMVTLVETSTTSVNSSTRINAPNLKFSGEANALYWFEVELHYTALPTPKFDAGITFPSGVTLQLGRWLRDTSSNVLYNDAQNSVGSGFGTSGGLASNSFAAMRLNGTAAFGATAGTFQVQFSQTSTDNANPSYLLAGSFMNYRQIS